MKKIIFLTVIAVIAFAIAVALATVSTVPLDVWRDIEQKIQPGYIAADGEAPSYGDYFHTFYVTYASSSCEYLAGYVYVYWVFNPIDGNELWLKAENPGYPTKYVATLRRGFYIVAGWKDLAQYDYVYVYDITGLVAYFNYGVSPQGSQHMRAYFNNSVYYKRLAQINYLQCKVNPRWGKFITALLDDWRGGGGGNSTWIVFNVTGDQPIYYDIYDRNKRYTYSYGGGEPIYMLYFSTAPSAGSQVTVEGSGLNATFGAGAYFITGSNFFQGYLDLSEGVDGQANETNTATLTVTVTPSNYKIQYLSAGALVAEANGTLSHSFVKNQTVTVRILDVNAKEKYKFDVKMDKDKYYHFNFGTDESIYNPAQKYTLSLEFFEIGPNGEYRGALVVDTVKLTGINASITRTASGISSITWTDLPAGHYQLEVKKEGYYDTRVWINLDSSKSLWVGLIRKADTAATDKPCGYVSPDNSTEPYSAIQQARNETPPAPSVTGNFYGFHFIAIDPSTKQLTNATVTISAVKRVGKVFWEDTVTVPLDTVVVNGHAYWYKTQEDIDKALQYAGFWESFGGFKITQGTNSMFVPAELARNNFYELIIYTGLATYGTSNVQYSAGLFESSGTIAQLMPILILAMVLGLISSALKRKK